MTRDPKRQAQTLELQTDSQKTGGFKTQEREQRGRRWHHSKFRPRAVDDKKGNEFFDPHGTTYTLTILCSEADWLLLNHTIFEDHLSVLPISV